MRATVCIRIGPFADPAALAECCLHHPDIRFLALPKALAETVYGQQVITPPYPKSARAHASASLDLPPRFLRPIRMSLVPQLS